jgi:hypothetical protein
MNSDVAHKPSGKADHVIVAGCSTTWGLQSSADGNKARSLWNLVIGSDRRKKYDSCLSNSV